MSALNSLNSVENSVEAWGGQALTKTKLILILFAPNWLCGSQANYSIGSYFMCKLALNFPICLGMCGLLNLWTKFSMDGDAPELAPCGGGGGL